MELKKKNPKTTKPLKLLTELLPSASRSMGLVRLKATTDFVMQWCNLGFVSFIFNLKKTIFLNKQADNNIVRCWFLFGLFPNDSYASTATPHACLSFYSEFRSFPFFLAFYFAFKVPVMFVKLTSSATKLGCILQSAFILLFAYFSWGHVKVSLNSILH